MTFSEIWNQLLRKKPNLAHPNCTIEITGDNLQQLLRQVYEQGKKAAEEKPRDPFGFGDIFKR